MRHAMVRRVLVIGVVAVLGACASEQERLAGHLEQGHAYAEQGRDAEALIEFRNALKLDPKDPETNYQIAQTLIRQEKYGDAVFYLREVQRLDPTRSDAALAEAKLVMGEDVERARGLVAGVLEREPGNALAHVRRMEVALHQGDTDEALAAALTAIELDPDDGLYPMQLGIVRQAQIRELRARGEEAPDALFEQALEAFRKADALYDGNVFVRINIGKTYLTWGDHQEEAAAAFRSAIELANASGDVEQRRVAADAGLDYARIAGDTGFAVYALGQRLEADPADLDGWSQLAALREQAEAGAGRAVFEELLAKRPEDPDAHWRYAAWLFRQDAPDDALAHLAGAAETLEDRAGALDRLSAMQIQTGRGEAAEATVETLQREFPGSPEATLAAARLAVLQGRYEEAAPLLRTLAGQAENAEGQRLLAVAELHQGNFPAAVAAVDRSLALGPANPLQALLLKARIHHAARDWNLALRTWQQVARRGLQIPQRDRVLLAQALYAAGRGEPARQVLENLLDEPDPPVLAVVEYANREGERHPERALGYLESALESHPDHPGLLVAITRVDLLQGRTEEALARLDAAEEAGAVAPAVLLARARILAGQGDFDEAERDVNRVFEAAPNLPGALDLLVQIYAAQDKLDEAIASFEQADRVGALGPAPRVLLGRLYLSRGEAAKARDALERALEERPDLFGAKNDLAFLLARDGEQLDRALELAQEAQGVLAQDPNVADTLGYVYRKKGLLEPALQQHRFALQLAAESGQESPLLHYHLGLVLQDLGRQEEAVEAFRQALAIDPEFPEAGEAREAIEAAGAQTAGAPASS